KLCEAQMEGGSGMGIGRTLYEQMVVENGVPINPNFVDYKLSSIMEIPVMDEEAMAAIPQPHREGPFGAKGFSEGAQSPTAPAIANALYNALGVRIKDLIISREKVLQALRGLKR
ncbi:molybdopterin cofactor-binding domain-containing protein, partial [Chloroflexota bacterium]